MGCGEGPSDGTLVGETLGGVLVDVVGVVVGTCELGDAVGKDCC